MLLGDVAEIVGWCVFVTTIVVVAATQLVDVGLRERRAMRLSLYAVSALCTATLLAVVVLRFVE